MSDKNKENNILEQNMNSLFRDLNEKEKKKKNEERNEEVKKEEDNITSKVTTKATETEATETEETSKNISDEKTLDNIVANLGAPSRKKTMKTVYIAQEQDKILKYIAKNSERSQGEMIRMALDLLFEKLGLYEK